MTILSIPMWCPDTEHKRNALRLLAQINVPNKQINFIAQYGHNATIFEGMKGQLKDL